MMVCDVLVQANVLVNGTTITQVTPDALPEGKCEADGRFTYFHIELEDHALILAEGAASETFVDADARRRFDNSAEFLALYGADAGGCEPLDLPRITTARQMPRHMRARLNDAATGLDTNRAA